MVITAIELVDHVEPGFWVSRGRAAVDSSTFQQTNRLWLSCVLSS